ncbi:nitrate reductase [Ancylobacter defluvii]|uniref:nitrate reductase (cytochrome) n=1 Tax=Ancylobacter defluvii TaxID=1282440 RepID=A0A9W6JTF0_9HYPH|nr:nitrate reductase [Ancylobacter defluvii]MBS7590509.1 nitrate reductase [Ancylobacter defluvii]GLK83431.1 nitrate reductase [Ancylobacter defluvii]
MNAPVPLPRAEAASIAVVDTAVRTTCPYCGVGCGVLASPDGAGGAGIAGDPEHPANRGRLCSKGSALGETVGLSTRLLAPMMRIDGALTRASWDAALGAIADAFRATVAAHGPDSVALYLSGQLLTEDYYAANKLAKGFLGTANVDTNSRLCMASSVAGHKRAFGSDTVPGVYADLDEADLVVLVGSNAAWCHPVLFRRLEAARARRGTKLVVIDPRRTATAEEAELFLPVAPGMDSVLFAGLLVHLAEADGLAPDYIRAHTSGFDAALAGARALAPDLATVALRTGVPAADIARFYALFAASERVVTCYSQGVNQSAQGTDKVGAIINCHLATGRIGRPGMGPFSLTGQPNAMGGREVGGLANQLAAHMGFSAAEVDRVRRFWGAPNMATREGLKAVDMMRAVAEGRIKALWVLGTNPAVSLPRADAVREALSRLDFLAISDNVRASDTLACRPHVLLPALAWGEKDGTVTNSERRISRQRAFLDPPGEAQPDWWAMAQVGRRLGYGAAFGWRSVAEVFREHAALSGFENEGSRDFDIGGLAGLDDDAFDVMTPQQWPVREPGEAGDKRFFAEGGFFTPDRRARFIVPAPPAPAARTDAAFPLRLNTGRIRDQWHTMTRTGLSPRLAGHLPAPFAEMHPADAQALGIASGDLVRLASSHGAVVLEARITDGQRRGEVFAPIHWSGANAAEARVNALVEGATDPFSGQPESKATPVRAERVTMRFRGFLLARTSLAPPVAAWWTRVAVEGGEGWLIADDDGPLAWRERMAALFGGCERSEFLDVDGGIYRGAAYDTEGRLEALLSVGPVEDAPDWTAVKGLLTAGGLGAAERRAALAGRMAGAAAACGPLVCSCFGVPLDPIRALVEAEPGADVARIGAVLKAGTNCGSCVPELKRLIAGMAVPA